MVFSAGLLDLILSLNDSTWAIATGSIGIFSTAISTTPRVPILISWITADIIAIMTGRGYAKRIADAGDEIYHIVRSSISGRFKRLPENVRF